MYIIYINYVNKKGLIDSQVEGPVCPVLSYISGIFLSWGQRLPPLKFDNPKRSKIWYVNAAWFRLVYWALTPQQQPASYQGGEMMMMKSVFWWGKPECPEEPTHLRQVTDETFNTYGLCPVRGLNLGRSRVKQSELRRDKSDALPHRATAVPTTARQRSAKARQSIFEYF